MTTLDKIQRKCVTAQHDSTTASNDKNQIERPLLLHQCLVLGGVLAGGGPDREDERDLVDKISNVVDDVQVHGGDGAGEVAEEVAQGVDGPAEGHDELHGIVGGGDGGGSAESKNTS